MVSRLPEICAVPIGEKYRRESFRIIKARQGTPVNPQLPRQFSLLGTRSPRMKPQCPYHVSGRWESTSL